ncbi:MAG TPA: thioesterase [Lachnospiraceae bacterium]|uniref:thioesterase II family protein n=1 Tax=Anaerosporobacter sp. TaxID=1872529 RepID=UPI000EDE0C7B|nr:thioesterase domain-containing protein [Anaerosporobacter sp.]HAB59228.1 thioesterase [Lachnospiraceae bacterium]
MLKLYCIPYSGASATIYSKWTRIVKEGIKIVPLELAGRGRRMKEDFYKDVDEAAEELSEIIIRDAGDCDFAFFGHSLGARIIYDVYYKLVDKGFRLPIKIFFSASKAPQLPCGETKRYQLPDDQFINVVLNYDVNSKAVFENKELYDIFVPLIRADFRIYEEYKFNNREDKITVPVVVFYGESDDTLQISDIESWREVTSGEFKLIPFEGTHFFINENVTKVVNVVNEELMQVIGIH